MASLTMYDPATGKPVVVDSAQAGALFREGRATFAADQDVPVMGTDGKVRVIKGADAGAFFSSAEGLATGAASGQQLREQQLQDEFGGVGGQLGAAVAGAATGASVNGGSAFAPPARVIEVGSAMLRSPHRSRCG